MKKKISLLLLSSICILGVFARIPNEFQYQAVVRDDAGELLTDEPVGVKSIIRQGSADGKIVYEETKSTSTDPRSGVINIKIGSGTNRSRTFMFSDIDWSADDYFIEIQIDRGDTGSNYVSIGTQQLLSVPYAKYAHSADNVHIKSPDGKTWIIKVDNNGSISAEAITE